MLANLKRHLFIETSMMEKLIIVLFIGCMIACLTPLMSSSNALFTGMMFSLVIGNPYLRFSQTLSKYLLQLSVVGLGAGMNLSIIWKEGVHSLPYTVAGITGVMIVGTLLGKLFKIEKNTSLLITAGTAICGGSAIAAIAPTIQAKAHEISVSLATVFFLNAVALFIFPDIGHYFHLTQTQFGIWSALAIHDTSSVVGSALQYGPDAVAIATTVKLVRALWIIPLALCIAIIWHKTSKDQALTKPKYPWFIAGFILVAGLVSVFPDLQAIGMTISKVAKQTLILTLFLIGSTLTRHTLRLVGVKPLLQGIILWILMGSATLAAILLGLIA